MAASANITIDHKAASAIRNIRDMPFQERGDALSRCIQKAAPAPTNEALKETATAVIAEHLVGTSEMGGMMSLATVYDHLADFARSYEGFETVGSRDNDLLEEIPSPGFPNITHQPYLTLQVLYKRLALESIRLYTGDIPP